MLKFQDKHSAFKSQNATTIVSHKAVDPSVITQTPVTLASEMVAGYEESILPLDDI